MGIKNLNKLIKQLSPKSIKTVPITLFNGYKVAVDFDILLHKFYSNRYTSLFALLNPFIDEPDEEILFRGIKKDVINHLNTRFVRNNITPIIVLGCETPDEKRQYAHIRRQRATEAAKKRLAVHMEKYKWMANRDVEMIDYPAWEECISRKVAAADFPKSLHDQLANAVEEAGFSIIQAKYEAEELCAALCVEDRVQAVYSTDTDNIVRCCPILITNIFNDEDYNLYANITCFDEELLANVNMTYSQFVEFCILLGCDYNNGITKVGIKTALKLFEEHGSLDEIAANTDRRVDLLNHKRCMEIFNYGHIRTSKDCCKDPGVFDILFGK